MLKKNVTCALTSEINVSIIELFSMKMDNVINKLAVMSSECFTFRQTQTDRQIVYLSLIFIHKNIFKLYKTINAY